MWHVGTTEHIQHAHNIKYKRVMIRGAREASKEPSCERPCEPEGLVNFHPQVSVKLSNGLKHGSEWIRFMFYDRKLDPFKMKRIDDS